MFQVQRVTHPNGIMHVEPIANFGQIKAAVRHCRTCTADEATTYRVVGFHRTLRPLFINSLFMGREYIEMNAAPVGVILSNHRRTYGPLTKAFFTDYRALIGRKAAPLP